MLFLALVLSAQLSPGDPGVRYQQPQLAAAGDTVAVAFGAGGAVYVSVSGDGGQSFAAPVLLPGVGSLALGRRRGPRVALTDSGLAVSAIGGDAGDLLAWNSKDGGKTWSAGVRINDVEGSAREGLHAMASGGNGQLYAAWLDLRGNGTRLYGAASLDGGATWSKNVLVYQSQGGTICECCHPSLAIDGKGVIHAMWRNVSAGNRDMYLSSSRDGGRTWSSARKLGNGNWTLNACPMDGGGLSIDREGGPVTVWRRQRTLFEARPGNPERQLGQGRDPAVAATRRGTFAAWTSAEGVAALTPSKLEPVVLDPSGTYVQLIARRDGSVLAAWESGDNLSFAILE